MKNWIKILSALIFLGIIGGFLGYKFIYNKPHRDYEKATPDFSTTAMAFFNEYRDSTDKAEQNYNGKVIELHGRLSKVEIADSLTIAVFALDEGLFGDEGIRCTMLPNHASKVKDFQNKDVTIKGFCSGYNDTDIIMEKCSVVNSKQHLTSN